MTTFRWDHQPKLYLINAELNIGLQNNQACIERAGTALRHNPSLPSLLSYFQIGLTFYIKAIRITALINVEHFPVTCNHANYPNNNLLITVLLSYLCSLFRLVTSFYPF